MFMIREKITLKYSSEEGLKIVKGKIEYETPCYIQLRIKVKPYRKVIYRKDIKQVL